MWPSLGTALIASLATAAALTGCGGGDKSPAAPSGSAPSAQVSGGGHSAGGGGHSGLIAFMRPGEVGEYDIWVVRPSGDGLRRLTRSPAQTSDYDPEWSPDGTHVLFSRRLLDESTTDGDDLQVIGRDGSGLHPLTDCKQDCFSDGEATWSPDGEQITLIRATGSRADGRPSDIAVYVMRADGSHMSKLTSPPSGLEDHYPTWSSDGRTIVFQRDTTTDVPGRTKLFAVDVKTGKERLVYRLPPWAPGAGLANFAPRGNRFLFGYWCIFGDSCPPSTRSARNAQLALMNADGSHLRRLHLGIPADTGDWSPDGRRIVFRCQPTPGEFRLCTSRLDGSALKRFPWPLGSAHADWGTEP
jgi:Tol biopolymer transport system component